MVYQDMKYSISRYQISSMKISNRLSPAINSILRQPYLGSIAPSFTPTNSPTPSTSCQNSVADTAADRRHLQTFTTCFWVS